MARTKTGKTINVVVKEFIEEVIAVSEKDGMLPWERGWHMGAGGSWNRSQVDKNGNVKWKYSTFNTLFLQIGRWGDDDPKWDGLHGEWVTKNQLYKEGGALVPNEDGKEPMGRHIIFYKVEGLTDKDGNPIVDDKGNQKTRVTQRYYNVYHVETMTTLEPKGNPKSAENARIEDLDEVIRDYVARSGGLRYIEQDSDRAYYSPTHDKVVVPSLSQFTSVEEFYSTVMHELVHSTGHKSRLNRVSEVVAHGLEDYSREELVAEMGASCIMSLTNYGNKHTKRNNIAYVQGWLSALKDDLGMLYWASSRADKAVAMILGR